MPKITTLLFDIGDVLIDIDWQRGYQKLLGRMHHDDGRLYTLEEITEKLHPGPYGSVWDSFGTGETSQNEFLAALVEKTDYQGDLSLLQQALTELFEPLPRRIQLLNEFALNPDFIVALVSDTNIMHMTHIEEYIPDIFKNIPQERRFYSNLSGKMKKFSGDFYTFVLQALDTKPEHALMIDDREQNKKGADEIGLNFLLVQKIEDLSQALKAYF